MARHLHQAAQAERAVAEESLAQAAEALQADNQLVRGAVPGDDLQQGLGEQGQGADGGQGRLGLVQHGAPGLQRGGIDNGGQQSLVVPAALRFPARHPVVAIGRVFEQPPRLAPQQRRPPPSGHMGDHFVPVFLLRHIQQNVKRRLGALRQIAPEGLAALIAQIEQARRRQARRRPMINSRVAGADEQGPAVGELKP